MSGGVGVQMAALGTILLASCGPSKPQADEASEAAAAAASDPQAYVWPAGFVVLGDGFPTAGDACRRLGETELTVNYLDDSAQLIGCPGVAGDAPAVAIVADTGGRVVGTAKGVTLISVPQGDANVGMAEPPEDAR